MHPKRVFALICVTIIVFSAFSPASVLGFTLQTNSKKEGVIIVADKGDNLLINASKDIISVLDSVNYHAYLSLVSSKSELYQIEKQNDALIIVYLFHGDLSGIQSGEISWSAFASLIEVSTIKHHILLSCYSSEISNFFRNGTDEHYVYTVKDVIDVKIAELEALGRI